ncbi:hypothetical protein GN244_ATG00763 [Phytophthora infestans]|uniref:Uncharacterized protein n=1 Tax=Phytophthora infestans TaxID=4787 RepID=A0A833TG41_PHYIN|nr:hypothetical protein GN244_ATG00763 [Phytophthora infestans]
MWDFSGKHSLHAAPKPSGYGDLVSALSTLHKFAEQFYNKETSAFIASARDFLISYNDHAAPDGNMARLLAYWVNRKLGIFRSRLASAGIKEALKVSAEFTRSDDMLSALKDSNSLGRKRPSPINPIPQDASGRRLCLRFISRVGCSSTDCSRAHLKPDALHDLIEAAITKRWRGLGNTQTAQYQSACVSRYDRFMSTLERVQHQCATEIYNSHADIAARLGVKLPDPTTDSTDDIDADVVSFWTTVAEHDNLSLPDVTKQASLRTSFTVTPSDAQQHGSLE